jgi:drug/metabolite transporter (DMT)-like permease
MIRNVRIRRSIALALAAAGAALLLLAPQNGWLAIFLIVAGLALEVIGMNLRHRDR